MQFVLTLVCHERKVVDIQLTCELSNHTTEHVCKYGHVRGGASVVEAGAVEVDAGVSFDRPPRRSRSLNLLLLGSSATCGAVVPSPCPWPSSLNARSAAIRSAGSAFRNLLKSKKRDLRRRPAVAGSVSA